LNNKIIPIIPAKLHKKRIILRKNLPVSAFFVPLKRISS